jgi:hypothetical protein
MRVYYMTSANWGEVILRERRLKLSRFHESNDPFELNLIDSRLRDTRQVVQLMTNYFEKNIGMICFSETWQSPVMWAHYAAKHFGVCLGFDVKDRILTPVTYTDEKISVPFGAHLPKFGLTKSLLQRVISTKSNDWKYEREQRVMGALKIKDPRTGFFYHDFGSQVQLREVIIGHKCAWTGSATRKLVGDVANSVRISKTRPAFGRFLMVEQRSFKAITVKPGLV